jgi:hypothetical protein
MPDPMTPEYQAIINELTAKLARGRELLVTCATSPKAAALEWDREMQRIAVGLPAGQYKRTGEK